VSLNKPWSTAQAFSFLGSLDKVPLAKPPLALPEKVSLDKPRLPDELVVWYRFWAGAGATLRDFSGYGNDGEIHGATWSRYGGLTVLSFDGVDDYVINTAPSGLPTGNSPITLECMFKVPPTFTEVGYFILSGIKGLREGYHILINYPDVGRLFSGYWGAGFDVGVSGMNDDKLHRSAGTYDGGFHRTYVDGAPFNTLEEPGVGALSGDQYLVGASSPTTEFVGGIIALVRTYNRDLSQREIRALHVGLI